MSDGTFVRLVDGLQIVEGPGGALVGRSPESVFDFGAMPRELVELFVDALGEGCTIAELYRRLEGRVDREMVDAVVEAYDGVMLRLGARPTPLPRHEVAIVGNGELATTVAGHLERVGTPARLVPVASFAGAEDWPATVLVPGPGIPTLPDAQADVAPGQLAAALTGCVLVVAALERVPYGALGLVVDAADRAGVPLLTLAPHPGAVVVGPLWAVGTGAACPTCVAAAAALGAATDHWPVADRFLSAALSGSPGGRILAAGAAREVIDVHRSLSTGELDRLPLASALRFDSDGSRTSVVVHPGPHCTRCGTATVNGSSPVDGAGADALAAAITAARVTADDRIGFDVGAREPMPYRTVGVVGGGTAGYLAALALRRRFPALEVTLLESSKVGVVGVGEATTPRLVQFLHGPDGLGLDIVELHERVRPVWKLGVYYDWSPPGAPSFPWPFQYGNVTDAILHDGDLVDHCLGASLMHGARTPLVDVDGERVLSLFRDVPFAYHLDNESFVSYLQEVAERSGVVRQDVTISRVEVADDGTTVDALCTEEGRRIRFDLYVDCSGFGSLLLGQSLGSPWLGYDDSLFCDAAVVADTPHDGVVRPYTAADTMEAGWCWRIAFDDADHRGYVFSTRFRDADEAVAEMRARNPGMGEPWVARFRSGRHADWWRGNVVALGNAYGFVEPLASTALHLLVAGIDQLSATLATNPGPAAKAGLSAEIGSAWDDVRCWLATQYRFNRRMDTEFWRQCRSSVALHDAEARVERYRERAPLTAEAMTGSGYFADDYSYDVVLAGQQVAARWVAPRSSAEEWQRNKARRRALAARALPHGAAVEYVHRRPDVLTSLVADPEGWIQRPAY